MTEPTHDITKLLGELQDGNQGVVNALLPMVYDELRNLAGWQLRSERADHTLNATALVHEAYLKLVDQSRVTWESRAHFFAIAAQAMRRILINYANRRLAAKRGGGSPLVTFQDSLMPGDRTAAEMVALDEALNRRRERAAIERG